MKTTLLILTLNEIDGVKEILPKIDKSWVDQILIVDGGSTDGTVEWAEENGYQVYKQRRRGIRFAYFEVWPKITGDCVITFSPDGNSLPELIPSLIQKMYEGYDMVIASRYLPPAKSEDDDFITRIGNFIFTKIISFVSGVKYSDAMVIFRIYKREMPSILNLLSDQTYNKYEKLLHTRISWEPIMSVRAGLAGMKITEIAGDEPARIGGERKLQVIRWGLAYLAQIIVEFIREKHGPRK